MKITPLMGSMHTHSTFCDGKNTMAEMAAAAYAAGVRYYGFSGHAHTPCPGDVGICMDADMTAYRVEADRLQQEYECRMDILIGIEWDACSDVPVPGWTDYWIGAVHNLHDHGTGEYYSVDWKPEELARCRDEMFHGDVMAMVKRYYAEVAAMAEKRPTILAHIDLITKLNARNHFFDEASREYQAAALEALHAVDPHETLLEINTGGMARGYRDRPYPAPFLLREWNRMGGRVILASDAHTVEGIQYAYDVAAKAAVAAGFRTSVLMGWHGLIDCPL